MFVAVYFNHNGGFVDPSHRQRKWARRRWGKSWMSEQEGTKGRRLEGNDEGKYKPLKGNGSRDTESNSNPKL